MARARPRLHTAQSLVCARASPSCVPVRVRATRVLGSACEATLWGFVAATQQASPNAIPWQHVDDLDALGAAQRDVGLTRLYEAPVECFRGVLLVASGRTALACSQSAGNQVIANPTTIRRIVHPALGVTWTLIVGTNEEPNVEKWDDAIGRRIVKIPSGPSLDPSEVDIDLESKIINEEVEGVLAWLVAGAIEWYRMRITYGDGLWMPPAVAKATSDFENDNDHVAEFVKACIDFGAGCSVRLADVNRAYQQHRGKGPRRPQVTGTLQPDHRLLPGQRLSSDEGPQELLRPEAGR